jgi:hypothetical protein
MEDVVRGLTLGMTDKPVTAASSPDVASSIGFTCGLIAVLLMFLLPGNLLSLLGIGYDSPGSFPAFKIHPSTYLTAFGLMATLLAVLQRKPVAGQAEWRVPVIFILLTVACALCSFLSVGTAGASNYVDTFVAAGALAMILATGGTRQRRKLGYLILALVLVNVVISFWESVADTHLIPLQISAPDLRKSGGWDGINFRPAGLFGHPLQAACVTSMGVFLLLAMRLGPWLSAATFGLLAAGLFSFGGRGALLVTFSTLVVAGVIFLLMTLARRALTPRILSGTLLAVLLLPPSLILLTSETNIGNRMVTHFYVDDSALVRAQQWDVLDLIDLREILYGTTREHVDQMEQQIGLRSQGSGIENPWLLLFLNLGIINLIPFLAGLSMFLVYLARRGGWPIGWLLVSSYIAIASTNNSLGVKTSDLSLLVAVVIAMSGFRNQTSAVSSESKLHLEPQPLRSGSSQSRQLGLSPNVAPNGNRPLLQR